MNTNKKLEEVYRQYEKEKDNIEDLTEILKGRSTLLGISPLDWEADFYDSHVMLYDWLFAKKHRLIKKVGINKEDDEENVITVPTELGKQMYKLIEKRNKKLVYA